MIFIVQSLLIVTDVNMDRYAEDYDVVIVGGGLDILFSCFVDYFNIDFEYLLNSLTEIYLAYRQLSD